jgi:hypothetical protein
MITPERLRTYGCGAIVLGLVVIIAGWDTHWVLWGGASVGLGMLAMWRAGPA